MIEGRGSLIIKAPIIHRSGSIKVERGNWAGWNALDYIVGEERGVEVLRDLRSHVFLILQREQIAWETFKHQRVIFIALKIFDRDTVLKL